MMCVLLCTKGYGKRVVMQSVLKFKSGLGVKVNLGILYVITKTCILYCVYVCTTITTIYIGAE